MGVEINRLPDAAVRKVKGAYAPPAEVKHNRLLRKYRAMGEDQLKALDVKALSPDEAKACKQVINERLAAAFKATQEKIKKEDAALMAMADNPPLWLSAVPPYPKKIHIKPWLDQITFEGNLTNIPVQMIEKLTSHSGVVDHHGPTGQLQGKPLGRLVVRLGSQKVDLGPYSLVEMKTTEPPSFNYDEPVKHEVIVQTADPIHTARLLGWEPACGEADCKNVEHWAKV